MMGWLFGDDLIRAWERGLGFRKGDKLMPLPNADLTKLCYYQLPKARLPVTVYKQNILTPSQYEVVAENKDWKEGDKPRDRFVWLEIDGHDWERVK